MEVSIISFLILFLIFAFPILIFFTTIYMRNRKMKMAILIAIFEFILYMVGATILQFYLPADLGSIIYLIEYYIIALIVIILFNVLFFKKTIDSM